MCLFSPQVVSIEKAESTSSLPNPIIVSIRTKKAFQLIELQNRDELVDNLNTRLRAMQWKQSMFRSRKDSRKSLVFELSLFTCFCSVQKWIMRPILS